MEDDPHRVLARNAACHQCRRRKLKCDAVRPTCGNCRKPRQRGPIKYEPPEPCTWDEVRGPSARTLRKREAKQRRAAQDAVGGGMAAGPPEWAMNNGPGPDNSHAPTVETEMYMPTLNTNSHSANGISPSIPQQPMSSGGMPPYGMPQAGPSSATVPPMDWSGAPASSAPPPTVPPMQTEGFSMNDMPDDPSWTSAQLIHSNWSRDLPVPAVVHHVVQVFFERVPVVTKVFHKPNFLCRLQLPPQHMDYPTVVLHGILAVTAPFISVEALASRAYFPTGSSRNEVLHPDRDFALNDAYQPSGMLAMNSRLGGTGTPLSRFQMWHRRKCIERLSSQMSLGQGLLDVMYANLLITYMDYMNGWFVDVWMEAMSGVRMGVGLSLNNSSVHISDSLDRNIAIVLPPVQTAVEQAERDRLWWMSYLVELLVCSGMSWPCGLPEEEITVELPVTQALFEAGQGSLIGVQTLHSPDLYTNHPPQHLDTLSLMIKALRLFTATNTFIRKYSRGEHTYQRYISDPRLRQLFVDINAFRMSWPSHFRSAIRVMEDGSQVVDPEMFLVIGFTHVAVVNLGEPLITRETWANDAAKMVLSAIRAILSFIYEVNATSYDITLLPPQASFIWVLPARCLGRFITGARLAGDTIAAGVFEAEYQMFENVIIQLSARHPVARRHVKRMEFFRSSWVKHGEIKHIAYDKDQVWDEEFDNKQKVTASSAGSQHSPGPANITELHTPSHGGSMPAMSPANHVSSLPTATPESLGLHANSLSSPSTAGAVPMPPHSVNPGGVGVSPTIAMPSQLGGMPHLSGQYKHPSGPQMTHPAHQGPSQHHQHQQHPHQQQPHQQQPHQQQPHQQQQQQQHRPHAPQHAPVPGMPHMMPPNGEAPSWLEGMDTFNISSYSFDVDSMLATLQDHNPNATFNGTTMFSLST